MTSALFGYTGFVGGNLAREHGFDHLYNSSNAGSSAGEHFDLVVFAAAKAEKWRINQEPDADLAHIEQLEGLLEGFSTERLVLISTVDVYRDPVGVDETTVVDLEGLHAYGAHRYRLEQSARDLHPGAVVLRLPGLFGPGLKKNVIFDLQNNNNVDRIHRAGSFQYYNLAHLWNDVETAVAAELPLVNLASEPVRTDEIAREAFGMEFTNEPEGVVPGSYDMRSIHASVFGSDSNYAYSKTQILDELRAFVANGNERP